MAIKITTLIENSPGEHKGLISEHGLSFYIEKDSHTILFDTGQSDAFLQNALQLKLDLSKVNDVVLSHGHYDHSGGLRSLTQLTTHFRLTVGQGFFHEKYGENNNSTEYLGNSFDEKFLKEKEISYRFTNTNITELTTDVYVVTNFPRIHKDEIINPRFSLFKDGSFQPDPFSDEVLLTLDSSDGLVLLLGCSHPGMKNMVKFATKILGRPLYAILGGTHLVESDEKSMGLSMDFLNSNNLKAVGVSHCTGKPAMDRLAVSNSRFYHNRTGSSLYIP